MFGAGFWTRFQLAAWREMGGVDCAAIYNRTRARAEAIASEFGIPAVFDDPAALLDQVRPDFVDNITEIGGHVPLSLLCARRRVPCICQKPMASSLAEARRMVRGLPAHRHTLVHPRELALAVADPPAWRPPGSRVIGAPLAGAAHDGVRLRCVRQSACPASAGPVHPDGPWRTFAGRGACVVWRGALAGRADRTDAAPARRRREPRHPAALRWALPPRTCHRARLRADPSGAGPSRGVPRDAGADRRIEGFDRAGTRLHAAGDDNPGDTDGAPCASRVSVGRSRLRAGTGEHRGVLHRSAGARFEADGARRDHRRG